LIRKSDGTTLYLTRDLATIKYRMDTWHPLAILYVVDHAQSLHFEQDFIVAKALGYDKIATASGKDLVTSLEHISFGRMSFGDRSMSTRKGNVIKLSEILDEAVKRAGSLAANKGSELPREDLYALTEIVGVASVKYTILSQDRNKDLVFDWDKIITLEGNSAPYLLYSYARGSSIVQKAEAQFGPLDLAGLPKLTEEAEKTMVRKLIKFPEALQRAFDERKPHIVSNALYDLCQEFNRFYGNVHVVNAATEIERRARLGVVRAFMNVLKSGLSILGIPVLDRM
jgi:arginyl-tRNA synthetase